MPSKRYTRLKKDLKGPFNILEWLLTKKQLSPSIGNFKKLCDRDDLDTRHKMQRS